MFLLNKNGNKTITKVQNLAAVGFEPTPPKRLVPKTSALDRSATLPSDVFGVIVTIQRGCHQTARFKKEN